MSKLNKQLNNASKKLLPDEEFKAQTQAKAAALLSERRARQNESAIAEKEAVARPRKFNSVWRKVTALGTMAVVLGVSVYVGVTNLPPNTNGGGSTIATDTLQVYALGASSAGTVLLSSQTADTASLALRSSYVLKASSNSQLNLRDDSFDAISEYLEMVEGLMFTPTTVNDVPSDRTGYARMMTSSYVDAFNETVTNVTYYNEYDIESDDDERESKISGVLIMNSAEYSIYGEKETEAGEYEIKMTISADQNNYVEFCQEIEQDEMEYSYKLYSDRTLVKSFKVEVETENNQSIVTLKTKIDNQSVKLIYAYDNDEKLFNVNVEADDGSDAFDLEVNCHGNSGEKKYKVSGFGKNKEFNKRY